MVFIGMEEDQHVVAPPLHLVRTEQPVVHTHAAQATLVTITWTTSQVVFRCAIPSSKSRNPAAPVAYDPPSPNQPPRLSTLPKSQPTNLQRTSLRSWMLTIRHPLRTLGIPQAPVQRRLLRLAVAIPAAPMPVLQILFLTLFLLLQLHMFRFRAIRDADILVLRQPPSVPPFLLSFLRAFQLHRRSQRHPLSEMVAIGVHCVTTAVSSLCLASCATSVALMLVVSSMKILEIFWSP